jgi:hypothetical protein
MVNAGEALLVPAGTVHAVRNVGSNAAGRAPFLAKRRRPYGRHDAIRPYGRARATKGARCTPLRYPSSLLLSH